ncbi:hypothetical protein [Neobacillus terrae]|uniref:hypothetical protein n=1 Tax=Neobacillus terrae TaxID=3034837 RepID=UPI00140A91B7|nr:hypothetical protein [Neobacillus terrae]NHM32013.1 hypothetical protein [Neobacillus terrae]
MNEFGGILDFTNEVNKGNKLNTFCKINVSPELVKAFEKGDKWEFTRMMEKDLRLTLLGFGEVLDFKNDVVYEPDKNTFKNGFSITR